MVLVSYDISSNKTRAKFSKFLKKFGYRLQYSVFEIENSSRILENIVTEVKNSYEPLFGESDSVILFIMSSSCKVIRMGYAKNDESDIIILS